MATKPRIIVTIDTDGSAKVTAQGYQGPACQDATKHIEEALGTVTDDAKTAEYHVRTSKTQQQQAKQGQ